MKKEENVLNLEEEKTNKGDVTDNEKAVSEFLGSNFPETFPNITEATVNDSVYISRGRVPAVILKRSSFSFIENKIDYGFYTWFVCFTSFFANGALCSIPNSFGILIPYFRKQFQNNITTISSAKITSIGTMQTSTMFICSPITSILIEKCGIRTIAFTGAIIGTSAMLISSFVKNLNILFLTYSVLAGIGFSFVLTPSISILGYYFNKRLGLASGIASFGSSAFTVILPIILNPLLKAIGLFNTIRCFSIQLAIIIGFVYFWKTRVLRKSLEVKSNNTSKLYLEKLTKCHTCKHDVAKLLNKKVWMCKNYRIWIISVPITFLGFLLPLLFLVEHAEMEFPKYKDYSNYLITAIGISSGIGRILFGKLTDIGYDSIRIQEFGFFFYGLFTILISAAKHFYALVFIAICLGLFEGCVMCMLGPITFKLLGPSNAGHGIGFYLGIMAIPVSVGSNFGSLSFDLLKSYKAMFYIGGSTTIFGAFFMFMFMTKVVPPVIVMDSNNVMTTDIDDGVKSNKSVNSIRSVTR